MVTSFPDTQIGSSGLTLLHSYLMADAIRPLLGSSEPQATQGQSGHVRAAPGTKENYLPREANTAQAVSRVSIPLFCVIKGPIVETQITQRWHVQCLIT